MINKIIILLLSTIFVSNVIEHQGDENRQNIRRYEDLGCFYFYGNLESGLFYYEVTYDDLVSVQAKGKYRIKNNRYLLTYDELTDTIEFEHDDDLPDENLYFAEKDYLGIVSPSFSMKFIVFDTIINDYKTVEAYWTGFDKKEKKSSDFCKIERKILGENFILHEPQYHYSSEYIHIEVPDSVNIVNIIGYFPNIKVAPTKRMPKVLKIVDDNKVYDKKTGSFYDYKQIHRK